MKIKTSYTKQFFYVVICTILFGFAACEGSHTENLEKMDSLETNAALNVEEKKSPSAIKKWDDFLDTTNGEWRVKGPKSLRVDYDTVYYTMDSLPNGNYFVVSHIGYGAYELQVECEVRLDSTSFEELNRFFPLPIHQNVSFYRDGNLRKRVKHPASHVVQKTKKGKMVRVEENQYQGIGIICGKRGEMVVITGYGGCNSCTTYRGYFSMEGKNLGEQYVRGYGMSEKIIRNTVNDSLLVDEYGVLHDQLILDDDFPQIKIGWLLDKLATDELRRKQFPEIR